MEFQSSWGQSGARKMKYSDFEKVEQNIFAAATGGALNSPDNNGQVQSPVVNQALPTDPQKELEELRAFKQRTLDQGVNDANPFLSKRIEIQNEPVPVVQQTPVTPQESVVNTPVQEPQNVEPKTESLFDQILKGTAENSIPTSNPIAEQAPSPAAITPPVNTPPQNVDPNKTTYVEKYNRVVDGQNKFVNEMAALVTDREKNVRGYTMEQIMAEVKNLSPERILRAIQADDSTTTPPTVKQMPGFGNQNGNPFQQKPINNNNAYQSVTTLNAPAGGITNTTGYFNVGSNGPEL